MYYFSILFGCFVGTIIGFYFMNVLGKLVAERQLIEMQKIFKQVKERLEKEKDNDKKTGKNL